MGPIDGDDFNFCVAPGEIEADGVVADCVAAGEGVEEEEDSEVDDGDEVMLWIKDDEEVEELEGVVGEEPEPVTIICKLKSFPIPA